MKKIVSTKSPLVIDLQLEGVPKFKIEVPSVEAAFHRLWQYLQQKGKKKNYDLFKVWHGTEYYDPNFYQVGVNKIKDALTQNAEVLKRAFSVLRGYSEAWGFDLKETYTIIPIRKGSGGEYDHEKGVVLILVTKDGIYSPMAPIWLILHEIIHIGIEENCVQAYGLNQAEKEGLVYRITKDAFSERFEPEYSRYEQYVTDPKWPTIMKFLDDNPDYLDDVPRRMSLYTSEA